ncbi:hypothetical protein BDW22DRAFT_1363755 [Trametopsis cervina]|nr:hypothetical protein BDW22DRAFT_1363755 [Trametopsis cervina]
MDAYTTDSNPDLLPMSNDGPYAWQRAAGEKLLDPSRITRAASPVACCPDSRTQVGLHSLLLPLLLLVKNRGSVSPASGMSRGAINIVNASVDAAGGPGLVLEA